MKEIAVEVAKFGTLEIQKIEKEGHYILTLSGEQLVLESTDFEIAAKDLPGWSVATDGGLTVALDIHIDDELWREGVARELVNRIQNGRKNKGFELTDRISIELFCSAAIKEAAQSYAPYINEEVLSDGLIFLTDKPIDGEEEEIEKNEQVVITIKKTQNNGMVI